ncbi:hypothetical protein OBBRIDRAFT_888789 [Obba rivulosa]|uniref:Uncharacterized protein n=1 Tax=Obba rivulosa TaxID=1052685 RepID=A0A8E2DJ25_9APHY|nr:hypothetical protein OBBRIDRAFT_888789 [Obba rivulosa]
MGRRMRNSSETIKRVSTLFTDVPGSSGEIDSQSLSQAAASSSRSQAGPSAGAAVAKQTKTATKSKRKNDPPRSGQEVIVLSSSSDTHITVSDASAPITVSSDAHSHITVSSGSSVVDITDLVAARRAGTRQPMTNAKKPAAATPTRGKSRMSPPPSSSGSAKRPSSSHRPSVGSSKPTLLQTTLNFTRKRKHDEPESSSQPGTPSLRLPTPSLRQTRSPSLSQQSSPSGRLAPRDNVPAARTRSHSVKKPSPPKKARLSSPEHALPAPGSGHSADRSGLVPSSQSDEQELCAPKVMRKDPAVVKENVDRWRKETSIAPSRASSAQPKHSPSRDRDVDAHMDADFSFDASVHGGISMDSMDESMPPAASDMQALTSETEVSMQLRMRNSASTLSSTHKPAIPTSPVTSISALAVTRASSSPAPNAYRPVTPPPEEAPQPRPVTPLALTPHSKAAKIIADIKARALAAALSSEEEGPIELGELSDSSSSDSFDIGFLITRKVDKGKGKAVSMPPPKTPPGSFSSPLSKLESSPQSPRPTTRYNLRNRYASASSSDESDHAPAPLPVRKPRKTNPLDALLKEKQQADKRGKGASALRFAEEAVESYARAKQDLKDEADGEESGSERARANEDASRTTRQGAHSSATSPCATSDHDSGSDDDDLGDVDLERLLGEEGKAVGRILANDRTSKEAMAKARRKDRVLGVPLWEAAAPPDEDRDMKTVDLPAFPLSGHVVEKDSLLRLLSDVVVRKDFVQITMVLNTGMLSQLSQEHRSALVPWLYNIATSFMDNPIKDAAYNVLLHFSTPITATPRLSAVFPFAPVVQSLKHLGAKAIALEIFGMTDDACVPSRIVDETEREDVLFRVVSLITAFSRNGAVSMDDLPNMMLAVLLIALDPSSSSDLKRDAIVAFETLGQAIPDSADGPFGIGSAACSKIIKFAKDLKPFNQVYLLSFIMGSSPQTARMARWIARRLLLDASSPIFETYSALPPLAPVVEVLSAPSGSEGPFDILGNADKPDYYENLACYVELLSRTLTDIDEYVAEELAQDGEASMPESSSPSKMGLGKEKPPTPLEQIKTLLDRLHGKIVDTRAADLDRSRAKAALQRLSFCVHYQRIAILRSAKAHTRKPRNLHSYFASPSK